MRAAAKRPGFTASLAGAALICGAIVAFEYAATEAWAIGGGDAWSYSGEVVFRPGAGTCTSIPCSRYCEDSYCAHGTGHLGTDGSWWYDGTFVDGRMEGIGRLENDFYVYEGGFKNNEFDGPGTLTCLSGPRYEGAFAAGKLIGEFRLPGSQNVVKTRLPPGARVGWEGPCDY